MRPKNLSKYLSLLLRHKPEKLALNMDENGWVNLDELLGRLNETGKNVTLNDIKEVVDTNDKQRFKLDEEHNRIRANQGHSIQIDVELESQRPPSLLYHGTAQKNLESILKNGLNKMNRQHVHLSKDIETANRVGSRHGKPIILRIDCEKMEKLGFEFYLSENGVWLTDIVPVDYIKYEKK